jgi:hypothetical protein
MTSHRRATRVRYHVTVTEIIDGQPTTIMDAWAADSTPSSATSTPPGRLQGGHGKGGPLHLREHLADLITGNPT